MTKLILILMLVSSTAFAKELLRVNQVKELQEMNKLSNVAAYLSKRIVVTRNYLKMKEVDTDDSNINTIKYWEVDKEIISKNIRGRIIDLQVHEGLTSLYVSFDQSCLTKDCAYIFVEDFSVFKLHTLPRHQSTSIILKKGWLNTYDYAIDPVYLEVKTSDINNTLTTTRRAQGF
jgi:hypothetical protein